MTRNRTLALAKKHLVTSAIVCSMAHGNSYRGAKLMVCCGAGGVRRAMD